VACGAFLVGTTTKARGLELCLGSSSRLVLVRLGTEGSAGPGLLTVPEQAPRYAVGRKAALVFVFFLNYFWLFVPHTRRLPRRGLSWGSAGASIFTVMGQQQL
jgi:hypothetical protein